LLPVFFVRFNKASSFGLFQAGEFLGFFFFQDNGFQIGHAVFQTGNALGDSVKNLLRFARIGLNLGSVDLTYRSNCNNDDNCGPKTHRLFLLEVF
jgi:hypothetical protein